MKKLSLIFGLALGMLTVSCSQDFNDDVAPVVGDTVTLGVTLDEGDVRTSLGALAGEKYSVLWSAGDKLAVNGVTSSAVLDTQVGTTYGQFTVEGVKAPYEVLYPAEALNADGTITIATEQVYTPGSFANGNAVLVGYSTDGVVAAKHLYSFVKINVVKGIEDVALKSVTVKALGGEAISGTFEVDYQNATITPAAGQDLVRVSSAEGVAIGDGVTFVAAIPAGNYSAGFEVTVADENGKGMTRKATHAAYSSIPGGMLLDMPALTYAAEVPVSTATPITTAEQLQAFLNAATAGDISAYVMDNGEVVLGSDIDLTGVTLTPAATFTGVFNGQGYALKNWTTSTGIFTQSSGVVKNVVIDSSCNYTVATSGTGDKNCGFVVENNTSAGVVSGCINNGNLVATDLSCAGHRIGGLVGVSYGTVKNCVNNGDVNITSAAINNNMNFGGVVGYVNPNSGGKEALETAFLSNCINNGDVIVNFPCQPKKVNVGGITGATQAHANDSAVYLGIIQDCKNTGKVSYHFDVLASGTYTNVGGVIGYSQADILNCDNTGDVSFTTPLDDLSVNATRPSCGGVVGCAMYNLKDSNNHGNVTVSGIWAAGTANAELAGGSHQLVLGGVAGVVGKVDYDNTKSVENCSNYGKVDITAYGKTGGASQAYAAGVVALTTVDVKNSHNYGELNLDLFAGETYSAGVVGYCKNGTISGCSNNATANLTSLGATSADRTQYFGGVTGRAYKMSDCNNNGATTVTINECATTQKTLYTGGVSGYVDTTITGCTLNAAYSLTTPACAASLRCGGVVGQVKTATDISYTVVDCSTTGKASVSITTKNTKANYIAGVAAISNNGVQNCINNANVNVTITEALTGTAITYVAGVAGLQKGDMNKCQNHGDITADMCNSTSPLYLGGLLGHNNAATATVTTSSNSGDITVTNAGTTDNIGVLVGLHDDGATASDDTTNTGALTVNGTAL